MVILVGPQAIGKTTQARMLKFRLDSKSYDNKICVTDLIQYTFFHLHFQKILRILCQSRRVMGQFYEGEAPKPTVDPQVYRKLFMIQEALHMLGFVLSLVKQKTLIIRNKILIEYEGYVFKQLADLWFLANELKVVDEDSFARRLLHKITAFLLSYISRFDGLVILLLEADFETIRTRCSKDRSRIEPWKYVMFQRVLYDKIITMFQNLKNGNIKVVRIDANRSISAVGSDIFSGLLQSVPQPNESLQDQ